MIIKLKKYSYTYVHRTNCTKSIYIYGCLIIINTSSSRSVHLNKYNNK